MGLTKKIKVLELIRSAQGGMKEHFISLIIGLRSKGIDVVALCDFEHESMNVLRRHGVIVECFPLPGGLQPLEDFKRLYRLMGLLREYDIDIIHCHGFKAGMVGRLAGFLTGCKTVYTVHNFILQNASGGMIRKGIKWVEWWLCKHTDKIIAVSKALGRELVEEIGISPHKVEIIYNGVPEAPLGDPQSIRKRWGISPGTLIIGTVARLIPSKGLDYLLDALPIISRSQKNIVLMVVGSGPDEARLRKKAAHMGKKDKVIFTGHVSDIYDYYRAMDVFVLPTLSEGLGISIMEAMAAERAVIGTRVGGIPEIIKHRYNGYLVAPRNSMEIAAVVLFLLQNPELREAFGRRAARYVEKKFGMKVMVDRTAHALERVSGISTLYFMMSQQKEVE